MECGAQRNALLSEIPPALKYIMYIRILILLIFPDPCAVDNGGCDQVCAPGGTCLCTDGYTLDSDGKRCNGLSNV